MLGPLKQSIAVGCAALALASCGGRLGGTLGNADYNALYTRGLVQYAASSGEFATVVRGNPFGVSETPATQEAIANGLSSPGWLGPRHFTTNPKPETHWAYRVVIVFNPSRANAGDNQTCAHPENETSTAENSGRFVAVFCAADRYASRIDGTVQVAGGPGSPAFRNDLNVALLELLPPHNPRTERDGGGAALR